MDAKLFEVAAIFQPEDDDTDPEIVLDPDTLLAEDEKSAFMKTIKNNSETLDEYNMDDIEVIVRPFA